MRFFKENSEGIIKLFVNQLGIAIFSMFLYTAAGAIQTDSGSTPLVIKVLISVFSLLFYFSLLYTVMWEIGAKDKIRIDGGRANKQPFKGLLMGLCANIPNFVITLVSLLCYAAYSLGMGQGFANVFGVLNMIFRLFISMYLGVIQGLGSFITSSDSLKTFMETLYFLILPFMASIVVHISYTFGLKDIHIFPKKKTKK